MITCAVARNVFRPWDQERWSKDHIPGGLVHDYLPDDLLGESDVYPYRNSARCDLLDTVGPDDSLAFIVRPHGAGLTFKAIGTFFAESVLGQLLLAAALSFALQKLFPAPRISGAQDRDDDQSPTYSFKGISNNRSEGQPIAVPYGEMRMGGTVIGEYVTTVSLFPSRTDLNILFCFGEGPIHSIGDVEVDNDPGLPLGSDGAEDLPFGVKVAGNLAENYEGIEAHVRMGTQEQEVIPDFEDTRQTYEVGQKLTSTEVDTVGTGDYAITLGASQFTATNDAFWDEHGASFDLNVSDVDGMIIRIQFPSGYYRQDLATGGIESAWFAMQVRYRQLDSSGAQITTGGTNSDGWIRLPVVSRMPFSKRGSFEWEFSHSFRDKESYLNPVVGNCNLHGGGGRTGFPNTNYPFGANVAVDEFSFSSWVMPRSSSLATADLDTWWHIAGDYDNSSHRGWSVGFERKPFGNFGAPVQRWQWAIEFGNNNSRFVLGPEATQAPVFEPVVNQWHHFFVVYKSENSGPGTSGMFQLYINGQIAFTRSVSFSNRLRAPGSAENHIRIANNPEGTQSARFEDFYLDDVHMWSEKLSASRVAHLYNNGKGTSALIRSDVLVVNYTWDDTTAGIVNNADPLQGGQWYGDADREVGAFNSGDTGLVSTTGGGDLLRGQFHVEVIRANEESTAPSVSNVANFDIITSIENSALSYPNLALASLRIPATDQLNNTAPTCTFLVKGRLCPIWDGLSETNPGISFEWTQNPAWVALDILTNNRFGMGQFYNVRTVVLSDLLAWATYNDSTVYNGGLQQVMTSSGGDDVLYTDATTDPDTGEVRGSLSFTIESANLSSETIPTDWEVGSRIYVTGFPVVADATDVTNDINNDTGTPDDFAGYEIYEITRASTNWVIRVYWDRKDETDPWGDGLSLQADVLDAGDNFSNYTAVVSGGQARFAFNGVFDSHRSAWDALLEVCTVGRAIPIREGNRLRFKFNSARDPVGVIGLGSIIEDTFEINYTGPEHKPNVVEITILDEDRQFESATVEGRADELKPTNVGKIRKSSQTLFGCTNRHQAERQARFQVLVNERLIRTARWEMGANGLEYEPGDVVRIGHDVLPRGASGRIYSTNGSSVTDRIVIDRSLTIADDTTYKVYVQNFLDVTASGTVDTTVTVPGDYVRGDTIVLTGDTSVPFRQDDIWILVEDGKELLMEITSVSIDPSLNKQIEAIEYDATIYADENDFPFSEQLETSGPDNPINDQGDNAGGFTTETSLPLHVGQVTLSDRFTRTGPGQFILVVHAAWEVDAADRFYIDHTDIYVREIDDQATAQIIGVSGIVGTDEAAVPVDDRARRSSPWRQVASVGGYDEFAEFPIPQALIGREMDVAVCPVKSNGVKRTVSSCSYGTHTIGGFGPHPSALTSLTANLQAQLVTYAWDLTAGEQDAIVELRRTSIQDETKAGWLLAPVVFKGSPDDNATPPMHDWAGSTILGDTRIMSRTINSIGHKSDILGKTFNPSPVLDSFPTSVANDDQNWSDFDPVSNGWVRSVPQAGDPNLNNLEEIGTNPDNYLQFEGTNLTGFYATQHDSTFSVDLDNFRTPREYYVEAVLVAEQRHPLTWAEEITFGDQDYARWTFEGPTHLRPGEENCTLELQARFNIDGSQTGWSSYQTFRPGLYTFVQMQFRLSATRPATDYQIRIHKLETRITTPSRGMVTRTPYDAALDREFMD